MRGTNICIQGRPWGVRGDGCMARRCLFFFFSSRRRHTRLQGDWSSDVCSSDLADIVSQILNFGLPAPIDIQVTGPLADSEKNYAVATQIAAELRGVPGAVDVDRKSTRLNSSHLVISYAVFCLKKKNKENRRHL